MHYFPFYVVGKTVSVYQTITLTAAPLTPKGQYRL